MKTTNLGNAILEYLKREQLTQSEFCKRVGLVQSQISRLIAEGRRPEPESLARICRAVGGGDAGKLLLIEHLRDEVERAGMDTDCLSCSIGPLPGLEADLDRLRSKAEVKPGIRKIVRELSQL